MRSRALRLLFQGCKAEDDEDDENDEDDEDDEDDANMASADTSVAPAMAEAPTNGKDGEDDIEEDDNGDSVNA